MNLLSFGAPQGSGPGDACGRCFSITGTTDPNTGAQGTFGTIVVKVTDLCTDGTYCDQTLSNPINSLNQPIQCVTFSLFSFVPVLKFVVLFCSFALCSDTGAAGAFLPASGDPLIGSYQEVSCSEWSGSDGSSSSGSCLSGESAGFWPETGCGNQGEELSL